MPRPDAGGAAPCVHPPARLFTGLIYDPLLDKQGRWVACCACGALLKSGVSAQTVAAAGQA